MAARRTSAGQRQRAPEVGQRKPSIIALAIGLFARRGYRDTSLASIADAAGLTQPGLLHHFRSKEDLLLAVLRDRERRDGERVRETLADYPHDVVGALGALVEHSAGARDETSLHTVLAAEATSPSHPAHDYFVARYERVRAALLRDMLEQSGGTADEERLRALVPVVFAVMDGLQLQWMLDPEIDMVASFQAFERLLDTVLPSARDRVEDAAG